MLDIKKVQSVNKVTIVGTLSELNIEEKKTKDGKGYVSGIAKIKVDQDCGDGTVRESIVTNRMFSMRTKNDGNPNMVYDGIVKMKDEFISLAAAEEPSQASKIIITSGQIEENIWADKTTGQVKSTFQISSNFMRKAHDDDNEQATFELSGVVVGMNRETDKNGDETGRLKVKLCVIGYMGKANVIELVAAKPTAVDHIEQNWNKGDTVSLTGVINMTFDKKTWTEEQGFGEPIQRTKTISKKELVITGGSSGGLDESLSYDESDIKVALAERNKRSEEMVKAASSPAASKKSSVDYGF